MIKFNEEQIQRYSRHILLKDVGVEGQARIMESRVLIIGAGGLGAPAAFYLAAAGVGTLGIADGDRVDLSNLQRQIIHTTADVGREKVVSACYRCVFQAPPPKDAIPTCSQAGVLGAIAGMLGTIQAAEALKFVTGAGRLLTDRLLTFDAAEMDFRKIKLYRRADCPVCGTAPSITVLRDEEQPVCDLKRGR